MNKLPYIEVNNEKLLLLSKHTIFPPEILEHIKQYIYNINVDMSYEHMTQYSRIRRLYEPNSTIHKRRNIRINYITSIYFAGKLYRTIKNHVMLVYQPNIIDLVCVKKYIELLRYYMMNDELHDDCTYLFSNNRVPWDYNRNFNTISPLCENYPLNEYYYPKAAYIKMLNELIEGYDKELKIRYLSKIIKDHFTIEPND